MTEKSAATNVNNCVDSIDANHLDALDEDDDDDNRVG